MRVVAIRPRGTPREAPPPLAPIAPGSAPSAFPSRSVPFDTLDLPPRILQALGEMGYTQATEVQARAIPLARAGRDLMVQSRTGTGKTTAFGVPIVEKVDARRGEVQGLVLCPTRELSIQVTDELGRLGRASGVRVLSIYGGDSMQRQLDGLRQGAHVVVGTPGRILDHLRQRTLRFDAVRILVLDEADQMLDMGFEKEMKAILEHVPSARQTLMFSATIPSSIEGIMRRYQKDPERVMLSQDAVYVTQVQHLYYIVPQMEKAAALHKLIEFESPAASMIFCNTRSEVRAVYGYLAMHGLPVAMTSSDLTQKKREQVMRRFRSKELKHLVATDVAARGIDIEDLSHVFIYSSPDSSDQYIHRAGRTGRIGKSGKAISLVSGFDMMNFNRLVRANNLKAWECDMPSNEEVERREVRRVIDTVRGQIPALSQEERAEYETIARGIVADQESLALIASLLKTHFAEEAAKGVLDEDLDAEAGAGRAGAPGAAASTGAATPPAGVGASRPGASAQTARRTGEGNLHSEGGQPGSEPAPGAGRRRRRRRRRGGGGGPGGQGGSSGGGRFRDRGYV
jgi:ATP-dependent RNA helicase DeaD